MVCYNGDHKHPNNGLMCVVSKNWLKVSYSNYEILLTIWWDLTCREFHDLQGQVIPLIHRWNERRKPLEACIMTLRLRIISCKDLVIRSGNILQMSVHLLLQQDLLNRLLRDRGSYPSKTRILVYVTYDRNLTTLLSWLKQDNWRILDEPGHHQDG